MSRRAALGASALVASALVAAVLVAAVLVGTEPVGTARGATALVGTSGATAASPTPAGPWRLHWSSGGHVDPHDLEDAQAPLVAITCLNAHFCMTMDTIGWAYRYDGSRWLRAGRAAIAHPDFSNLDGISGLSCASPRFCVAVDASGQAFVFRGGAWSAPTTIFEGLPRHPDEITGETGPSYVSCPTKRLCMAVTADGASNLWRSGHWHPAPHQLPNVSALLGGGVDAVSCPSTRRCLASYGNGELRSWDGQSWSAPVEVDPAAKGFSPLNEIGGGSGPGTNQFGGITCPAVTACMAFDDYNNFFLWNGTTWSHVSVAGDSFDSISCPTVSFCVAGSEVLAYYTWSGGTWSDELPLATSNGGFIDEVSCDSPDFCVGVDEYGQSIVGRAPVHA